MEGQGTGGLNLDHRVGVLERSVSGLHEDSRKTQAAVAGLGVQVHDMTSIIRDISEKLDSHRMRRPDLQSAATTIIALLAIGGLAFAPIYRNQQDMKVWLHKVEDVQDERSYIIGNSEARIEDLESEIAAIRQWQNSMSTNRFTKEDGQRLLDQVIKMHREEGKP